MIELRESSIETHPWLPGARDDVITWTPDEGETVTIVVADDHDPFVHRIRVVDDAVAAGATEVARPSPRRADSLEIVELPTTWEQLCPLIRAATGSQG